MTRERPGASSARGRKAVSIEIELTPAAFIDKANLIVHLAFMSSAAEAIFPIVPNAKDLERNGSGPFLPECLFQEVNKRREVLLDGLP